MSDFRLAVRELRASPVVTLVAVLSLALGIGANTAIFSLINSLLLRPLPVVHPEQLAVLSDTRLAGQGLPAAWTYGVWEQVRERSQTFDGACAWAMDRLNVASHAGETEPVDGMWVSGDYFTTLGVGALLGRTIERSDDTTSDDRDHAIAVISYEFWQRRFAGAGDVVGRALFIEHVPFTVVGVTPPGFFGTQVGRTFDVAIPIGAEGIIRGAERRFRPDRAFYVLSVLLRLRPRQSTEAATGILRTIQPQIREAALPATLPPPVQHEFLKDAFVVLPASTGISPLRVRYERPLVMILIVCGLVLLVACANLANLQLARGIARRHDISVRMALGATRWDIARSSVTESLLLSVVGAVLGLLFARWSSRLLVAQLSTSINYIYLDVSLDSRVLAFTVCTALVTTIVFGLLPAVRSSSTAPIEALKEQARGLSAQRTQLSDAMVVLQVAVSVVILIAAGLFVRSFEQLASIPLGFDSGRILLVNLNMARTHVPPTDRVALLERMVRKVAGVPGVTNAAASMNTPLAGLGIIDIVHMPGEPPAFQPVVNGKLAPRGTYVNFISPRWFATYGTPIKAGRDFNDTDVNGAPPVVIVNEAFVKKFIAGKPALGATVAFERGRAAPVAKMIVGIVADSPYTSLRNNDVPTEYAPLAQRDFPGPPPADMTISVRARSGSPMLWARSVGVTLTTVDPEVAYAFRPMVDQISASLTQERLIALLSGFFGVLALVLASLGVYGVTAYTVVSRRLEIGIRMALGLSGHGVFGLVLSKTAGLIAVGLLGGAAVSLWASQFAVPLLYGVDARDPGTFIAAAVTLVIAALTAATIPTIGASRLDPASVLRDV